MSATRKLSQFRQLSLTCESPSPHQKRKTLKKQYSEDIPDFSNSWFDQGHEIRISLNSKNKKNDKNATNKTPPPIRIAWCDKSDIKEDTFGINEESVIIKKCKEVKRVPSGRLTRHASLDKDSILNSKQDFADRLRAKNPNIEKENDKSDNKTNLQIYLAHNTQDFNEDPQINVSDSQTLDNSDQFVDNTQPKFLQPLLLTNGSPDKAFQIRKSGCRKTLDSPKAIIDTSQKRPNFSRSNTIVVVPLIEKSKDDKNTTTNRPTMPIQDPDIKQPSNDDVNGINVIIRPVTAQSRRDKFQKRTNSAFHGTSKDQPLNFRPPLVRSSSAPSTKPEKSKFLATKRKLKTSKKIHTSPKDDEDKSYSNADAKEWNNAAPTAPEIVTMVSLLSPSGSDNEDCSEDEVKERPKSVLKRESSVIEKNANSVKEVENTKETVKNVSLRKTVKSVTFQQSSIHAVRSFSASFPARRGSMASTLALGNSTNGQTKSNSSVSKTQEKRGTNPSSPDANERVPKRRLVRSNTEEPKSSSSQYGQTHTKQAMKTERTEMHAPITIDIHTKPRNHETEETLVETSLRLNLEENVILLTPEVMKEDKTTSEEETKIEDSSHDTPKEKQCWAMYCKMTEKGINVAYDTILRGMLTPTEYRMRRKTSIAEEMNMMVNPPSTEEATAEMIECVKGKPNIG